MPTAGVLRTGTRLKGLFTAGYSVYHYGTRIRISIITDHKSLILASGSPRRRQLMEQAGYRFSIIAASIEEPQRYSEEITPRQHAESLAFFKASSVAQSEAAAGKYILAADTVVAMDNDIFGKPADAADARKILGKLAGEPQEVITGLSLLRPDGGRYIGSCVSRVFMRPMSGDQLDEYIASGLWQGKAGSYGIQDSDDHFVERIDGSFSNVVGLPMEMIAELLGDPAQWS